MRRTIVPALAVIATAVACSNGGGDGAFVRRSLERIPAALRVDPDHTLIIVTTDVARLADERGLAAPGRGRSGDEVDGWTGALSFPAIGGEALVGYLPSVLDGQAWLHADDVSQATGLELGAVTTITTAVADLAGFTVMTGDLHVSATLPEVADGVRAYGDGDDSGADAVEPSAWNPLGRPLRFATRDDAVAVSRSTPLTAGWRAGVTASLADDPVLGAIADVLDASGTISAYLVDGSFVARPPFRASADEDAAFLARVPAVAPFSAVGLGVAVVDGEARAIVAYAFATDDDATSALEVLADAWADGADADGRPIGEQLAVVGSEADGRTVAIELVPVGGETTLAPVRMLLTDSPVFMHPGASG